ncbi:MAG: ATP-binding protein [Bacteroidota bacterium]
MSGARRYWIYIIFLHALLAGLAWWALRETLYWFLLVELGIVISLIGAYSLYRKLIAPVKTISDGVAALNDQDFALRLRKVGSTEVDQLIEVYNRLLDNIRSERIQTRSQHFFLTQLISAADIGLIILDFDSRLNSINAWGRDQLEWDKKTNLPDSLSEIDHPLAHQLSELSEEESRIITLPGNRRYRCDTAFFIDQGFKRKFILFQDVSQELFAAEKEAYGQVIRMMAHEVNNSFGASRSIIDSLLSEEDKQNREWTDLVVSYLPLIKERGENLNRFMRRFADVVRLPEPEFNHILLNDLLSKVRSTLLPIAKEQHVQLDLYTSAKHPRIMGDQILLEQVIYNATINALESIGERERGKIEFRVICNGKKAGFTIVDNGKGISADEQEKIFSPFFSSKANGQGVGLTLSQDILRGHGATYSLRTDEDGLTRFEVAMDLA